MSSLRAMTRGRCFAALELLGYGAKGVIRELLMANGFQPGDARHHELRKTVARRYESR